jgi:uncharacterized protein with HEPN domain
MKKDYLVYIVDLRIVWDVVKQDIPQLRPHLQQILTDYGS